MYKKTNLLTVISALAFALFMIMQGAIIGRLVLFGDDFYYASFFHSGLDYFVSENVFHYMETNGRALVHLLDELLLANGEILPFKIFGFICIGLITLFSALITARSWKKERKKEDFLISLVICSAVFSFVSIAISSQTLYWATGFMNYVFPILLTLMLYFFTEKGLECERFGAFYPILALLACASTEQNAFASLAILLIALIRLIKEKRALKKSFVFALVLGLLGFVSLFFAPGNSVRTTYYTDFYSLSLIERIIQNIFRLSKLIFQASGATRILVIFFFCSAAYAFEKAKGVLRFILFSANALASALLLFEMNFGGIGNIAFDLALLTFGLDSILCLPKIFSGESSPMHFFTLMALVCQCAMLISPEMGPRTLLISIAFLFIPIALVFTKSEHKELLILLCSALLGLMSVRGRLFMLLFLLIAAGAIIFYLSKRLKPLSIIAALALIMLLSANSLSPIISGYAENYVYHKQNSILLDEYKSTMDDADGRTLEQHYLPNVYCKYTMPYDDPYHMHWYKIVKKIPIDTEIIYK